MAKKEVESTKLREHIASKQKIIIGTEKMSPNIMQPTMGTNQKVKIVVIVNQKPKGVQMKTQMPPSNMVINKWIHNTRKTRGPYVQMPYKKKTKWVKPRYHNIPLANHVWQRKDIQPQINPNGSVYCPQQQFQGSMYQPKI